MSILMLIGKPIITLSCIVFNDGITNFLIQSLFFSQNRTAKDVIDHIDMRKPLKISCCNCLLNRKNYSKQKKA